MSWIQDLVNAVGKAFSPEPERESITVLLYDGRSVFGLTSLQARELAQDHLRYYKEADRVADKLQNDAVKGIAVGGIKWYENLLREMDEQSAVFEEARERRNKRWDDNEDGWRMMDDDSITKLSQQQQE